MDDELWEAALWSESTRNAYLIAAEKAIEALRGHVALVVASRSEADEPQIEQSADEVGSIFADLSDAEFRYSATIGPFSTLRMDNDWDDNGDDEDELDPAAEHTQLSLMVRRDYQLTSEASVLEAGRTAYRKVWPDDSADAAADDVSHVGRALYQIMHADGIDALNDVAGLQPTAGFVLTVSREQLMSNSDLEAAIDDPSPLFVVDGEVLYSQSDIWH